MTLSLWLPLKDYQLPYSAEQELHQSVADIADYLHGLKSGPSEEKYRALQQYGTDVMNKYIDVGTLSKRALTAMIIENGYSYIIDLLSLTTEQLRSVVYYLPLIQSLKGTMQGLELLLSTFCDALEITEWWEDQTGTLPPYTMIINVIRLKNMTIKSNIQNAIIRFCEEYVYPFILSVDVHLSFTDGMTQKTFVRCDIINEITAYIS